MGNDATANDLLRPAQIGHDKSGMSRDGSDRINLKEIALISFDQLVNNLGNASGPRSSKGEVLVGRLLNPIEIEQITGATYCDGGDGHTQTGTGTFTQKGGSYSQHDAGYNMNCDS